jgi:hypothetical protein
VAITPLVLEKCDVSWAGFRDAHVREDVQADSFGIAVVGLRGYP